MSDFVVVGAGVIGLSSALALAEKYPASKITVVAEFDPESLPYLPKYTSPWAGAHFRPAPSRDAVGAQCNRLCRLTQIKFRSLAAASPELSIQFVRGVEYLEAPDAAYASLGEGYTDDMRGFRVLGKHELPAGVAMGTEYETFVLNPPVYLQYLYRRLKHDHGVAFVRRTLARLSEATALGRKNAIVVNCTGQGLQWHGGFDKLSFPIRGQTLLIRPPSGSGAEKFTITHQLKDGAWLFFIPRPLSGGVILGGTKQPGDTLSTPRDSDTAALVAMGARFFPQLMKTRENGEKYFDIVRVNVGFRPARRGGLRVESEVIEGHRVVHAYGCGPSGYELSYGVAHSVVELVGGMQPKL